MAHFYGTLDGQRGPASRLGSKSSGLNVVAASWQGAVRVALRYNESTEQDEAYVELTTWHGKGTHRVLYDGPVSGEASKRDPRGPRPLEDREYCPAFAHEPSPCPLTAEQCADQHVHHAPDQSPRRKRRS